MEAVATTRPVVWIVDDSPTDAERARRVLGDQYAVDVFHDGSAMLEHLAAGAAPDVVALDWVMPGVSGIEVCRFLRGGEMSRPELAILLLTHQNQTHQIVEGLAAGANDYLVKPYADPELRARVGALIRWNGLLDRAQKAEASVLQLLEHAPDPLIGVNRQQRVTFANAEAQRALGEDARALLGRPLSEVLPGVAAGLLELCARTSRPLPDVEIGDQTFSPSVRALPTHGEGGLTIALRNVTARRQQESRRLDFYSIIAHDLRSPLGAILMRTDLLLRGRRGVLSAEVISDLRKMDGQMRRLVALINDFLDFARMEESAHKMERTRVDLGDLIGEIVDDFKPLLDSTGQRIQLVLAPGGVTTLGDRRRLQQVIANLMANAIKFTPPQGTVTLRARSQGAWCQVEVEDDGPGIPEEIIPQLFQRYTRAPSADAEGGGTGLGLLIVREIVEAHGGKVGVDSTVGRGSRFWFHVPNAEPTRSKDTFAALS